MKEILFITLIIIKTTFAIAQDDKQNEIDSIKHVISSLDDKSLMATAYNQLGVSYIHNDTDSSIYYLSLSIQLGSDLSDPYIVGKSYNELSFVYREMGQNDSALHCLKNALVIVEQQNDPLGKAKLFYSMALIFKTKGQYDSAHALLNENLKILGKVQNDTGLAVTYNALGQLAEHESNYPLALDYYYDALSIYKKLENEAGVAILLNNIGIVNENLEQYEEALKNYNLYYQHNKKVGDKHRMAIGLKNAGSVLKKTGELDSAIFNFKTALRQDSLLGSKESISYDLMGLGSAYLAKDDLESAFQYYHRALKVAEDPLVIVPVLIGTGSIHMQRNSLDSAIYYLKSAIDIAEEVGLNNERKEAFFLLYKIHDGLGDFEKSFSHYRKYVEIKDSLFNEQNVHKMANIRAEFGFETERREQEILKNLEINRAVSIRNISIIGTLLTSIIAFLLYLIYRRKRMANNKLNGLYETVKRQTLELQALDQAKSQFYSNISHELRTPLTLISSPLEYLRKNNHQNNPEVKYYLDLMNRNTQHLKVLVDDILDLNKLESRKLKNDKEVTNISFLTKRIFSNFESLAKHRKVNYELDLGTFSEENIFVDQSKLEKILNNLLSNAFKYTSSGGEIRVKVTRHEQFISFEVSDNGQGIDAKDLPSIFDRYFQSNQPKVALQGGSGIGLALSKELTKVIDGELKVTSEHGKGSVFTLSIKHEPVAKPELSTVLKDSDLLTSESLIVSVDNDDEGILSEKATILVVEDHPEMQLFIKQLLKSMGNVLLANNGKQALNILSEQNVDLIISDVMMPEMNGYDLLKTVREEGKSTAIPFIMLTALKSEHHLLKALSIGVDDYLVKPFSPNELIARTKNMIERQKFRKIFINKELEASKGHQKRIDQHQYKFQISDKDREFVEQMEHVLLSHLEDENFSLTELADVFFMSYRQLERNTKKITGLTPKQFQQEVAMQHARKLLEEGKYGNPTAIAYSVGIGHVTRFSNLYEKRFGKKPESYF